MITNLKLPNIDGKTTEEKIIQLQKYLYQLVEELNYVLNQLDKDKE